MARVAAVVAATTFAGCLWGGAASAGQGAESLVGQQQASRQRALEASWGAELESKKLTPIQRVVKLLQKMREELQAEADKEAEMYDKMVCWCETNEKEKTKAIAEAEAKDKALGAEIQERAARFGQLSTMIEATKAEIAENKETLATATAIREKEAAEFRAQETESVQAITNLRNAITVLSKHQGTGKAMLQLDAPMMSGVKVLLRDVALKYELMRASREERHPKTASKASLAQIAQGEKSSGVALLDFLGAGSEHAAEVLPLDIAEHLVAHAAQPALRKGASSGNFLQAGGAQPIFESRSGARSSAIYGILTQMLEEFQTELSTTQKEELKAQEDFKELQAAKVAQIESGKKKLDEMEAEHSENEKFLSDAKEDIALTRQQRAEDVEFLRNLKVQCNDLDSEWHQRSATRANELTAVSEAIAIITEDDNRELMTKTVSLLQRRSISAEATSEAARRSSAAELLRRAAQAPDFEADDLISAWRRRSVGAGPKAQLSTLAVQVQLDAFVKVKEMMDKMVAELKQQQADEVKFKADCTENLQTNEKTIYEKTELKKDLEANMDDLASLMSNLEKEIKSHKDEIATNEVEIKKAGQQREAENADFQQVVSDQRATQTILQKALGKLKDFYEMKIGDKSTLIETAQEPPVKFNAYKTNAGSNSVIGLIEQIIEDSAKLEKEATAGETKAQADYEDFVRSSNGVIKSLQDAVVEKSDAIAAAKTDAAQAASDHESTVGELESLTQFKADLHGECDFVMKNFDIRQNARLHEIEAIQNAKAILSGAASQ